VTLWLVVDVLLTLLRPLTKTVSTSLLRCWYMRLGRRKISGSPGLVSAAFVR